MDVISNGGYIEIAGIRVPLSGCKILYASTSASGQYTSFQDDSGLSYQVPSGKTARILAGNFHANSTVGTAVRLSDSDSLVTESLVAPTANGSLGGLSSHGYPSDKAPVSMALPYRVASLKYINYYTGGALGHAFIIIREE